MKENIFTIRIYFNSRYQGYQNASRYNVSLFNGTMDINGVGKWLLDLVELDKLVKNREKIDEVVYGAIIEASKDVFGLVPTSDLLAAQLIYYNASRKKEPAQGFILMDVANGNILIGLDDEERLEKPIYGIYPLHAITADKAGRNVADYIASNEQQLAA